jgi:UDP-glucose 4-epimerase
MRPFRDARTIVARTEGCTYAAKVWDSSLVQAPFSVAPCHALAFRFAIFLRCGTQVLRIFRAGNFDAVIHFAAVAYVGESVAEPLRYYDNITSNTVTLLKTMTATGVNRLIYSRCSLASAMMFPT